MMGKIFEFKGKLYFGLEMYQPPTIILDSGPKDEDDYPDSGERYLADLLLDQLNERGIGEHDEGHYGNVKITVELLEEDE